jgi:hypothetical protein
MTERNPIAEKITGRYVVAGDWIVTKEEREAIFLLREAVQEIDRLQAIVNTHEATVEEATEAAQEELRLTINRWVELSRAVEKDGQKLRNAAQSFVTQYDKISETRTQK